jgi:hypothetical protein
MSLASEVTALRVRAKREFFRILERTNNPGGEDFSAIVQYAINEGKVPVSEFIDEFGISRGTVSRWARGKSLPHVMVRPLIVAWIKDHIQEKNVESENQASAIIAYPM